jgi:hypothetical protein
MKRSFAAEVQRLRGCEFIDFFFRSHHRYGQAYLAMPIYGGLSVYESIFSQPFSMTFSPEYPYTIGDV